MPLSKGSKVIVCVAVLAAVLFVAVLLDLSWASRALLLGEVWDVLVGQGTWANGLIVRNNSARIVMGLFVGAGLAVAGAVMQGMFRNPMASPYILGLSSGASFGAALGILFAIPFIPAVVSAPLLAFIFCLLTMFLVYSIARTGGVTHTETLLLTGIAVGSMMSALVSFLTFIAGDKMEGIVFWTMGNLGGSMVSWDSIAFVAPAVTAGIIVMLLFAKDLNAMMLGDAHAMDLGVDVGKVRLILLIASSLVTAAAVAFVGVIGFVGLIIPHIFRIMLGPDNRLLIPVSALGGATFLILCDYLARIIAPAYGVLPIGVLTALIGAPYFIFLLRRRKREIGWS